MTVLTIGEIKNMIAEYKAERQFARNKEDEADENGQAETAKVWGIIEGGYDRMISKLEDFIYNLKSKS